MKKTILFLALAAMGSTLSAQVFGVKGGVNMASMSGVDAATPQVLISGAALASFELSYEMDLTVEVGLTQRGYGHEVLGDMSFNQIVVSPGVAYNVSDALSVGVAPYVGFASSYTGTSTEMSLTGVTSTEEEMDFSDDDKMDYGVNLNLNFVLNDAILLSGGYSYGLKEYNADIMPMKNNGIMVSVGYLFNRY